MDSQLDIRFAVDWKRFLKYHSSFSCSLKHQHSKGRSVTAVILSAAQGTTF